MLKVIKFTCFIALWRLVVWKITFLNSLCKVNSNSSLFFLVFEINTNRLYLTTARKPESLTKQRRLYWRKLSLNSFHRFHLLISILWKIYICFRFHVYRAFHHGNKISHSYPLGFMNSEFENLAHVTLYSLLPSGSWVS